MKYDEVDNALEVVKSAAILASKYSTHEDLHANSINLLLGALKILGWEYFIKPETVY